MNSKTIQRRRNKTVTIRLSPDEYQELQHKVRDAGITQQAYVLHAIKNVNILSSDDIKALKKINLSLADLVRQIRGIAVNINQMAHVANSTGRITTANALQTESKKILEFKAECDDIWQSIRSLISQQ